VLIRPVKILPYPITGPFLPCLSVLPLAGPGGAYRSSPSFFALAARHAPPAIRAESTLPYHLLFWSPLFGLFRIEEKIVAALPPVELSLITKSEVVR